MDSKLNFQILDGMQNALGGVLRGAGDFILENKSPMQLIGRPTTGTVMNFIGYYAVSIPLYFG